MKGLGVPKDCAAAVEIYRKYAETGNPSAMFHLGNCLESGAGIKADPEAARDWWRKAAAAGHMQATEKLAP